MTAEYFDMCKKEIDAMRVRDPQGRRRIKCRSWLAI